MIAHYPTLISSHFNFNTHTYKSRILCEQHKRTETFHAVTTSISPARGIDWRTWEIAVGDLGNKGVETDPLNKNLTNVIAFVLTRVPSQQVSPFKSFFVEP